MDLGLDGRVAVVTGGSRGLGLAIARVLLDEGADVAIAARDRGRLDRAAAELGADGGRRVAAFQVDTGDDESVRAMVAGVQERFGRVDILVNNAAIPGGRPQPPLGDITAGHLWDEVNVKVMGYLRCVQAVVPLMREQGWGRIVNIAGLGARSSGSIVNSIRNVSVAALTKNLADQLGPDGIGVTVVHPGATRTESALDMIAARADEAGVPPEEMEVRFGAGAAIGRLVEPEEVAWVVAFLCSPKAVAITGDAIVTGGGVGRSIYY
jgi:NAD(P)-dependent dehydrogenase (short-subunit alcohol dehydrogenase family)